jgi:hypothetical protein
MQEGRHGDAHRIEPAERQQLLPPVDRVRDVVARLQLRALVELQPGDRRDLDAGDPRVRVEVLLPRPADADHSHPQRSHANQSFGEFGLSGTPGRSPAGAAQRTALASTRRTSGW